MIEVLRYVLAAIVVETHVGPFAAAWPGWQAVFAFYTLSGYLMTRILNERYGFSPRGVAAFLVNRVLRLWPAYLSVVAATLLALRYYPLDKFFFSLKPLATPIDQVTVLTILGQVGFDFLYVIPLSRPAVTSWSLSIELFCYCLLAFYFGRSATRLWVLAALGAAAILLSTGYCAAHPSSYYGPYCFQNRYGVLQAGFIPFALGGLLYFRTSPLHRFFANHRFWIASGLLLCEVVVSINLFAQVTLGPFFGAVAMAWLLASARQDSRPSRAVDFIGRASYHLFIAHMSIAAVLVLAFAWAPRGWSLLLSSLAISLALSAVLVPLEWRLNSFRTRIAAVARTSSVDEVRAAP